MFQVFPVPDGLEVEPLGRDRLGKGLVRAHADRLDNQDRRPDQNQPELDYVGYDHAIQPAEDGVDGGDHDQRDGQRVRRILGQEGVQELPAAPFGEAREGHGDHHGQQRVGRAGEAAGSAVAEADDHPLGPGHNAAALQPFAHEGGETGHDRHEPPFPLNPEEPLAHDVEKGDDPHHARHVEVGAGAGNAQQPPGHAVAAKEVGIDVRRGHPRQEDPGYQDHNQVGGKDRQIDAADGDDLLRQGVHSCFFVLFCRLADEF